MIANPGSVAGQMPYGEDALIRKIQDLERQMRELGPAIQTAVGATVSGLAASVATLTTQQATLTNLVNTALAVATGKASGSGWGLPASEQTLATGSIAIPSGFTTAAVLVFTNFSVLGYTGSGNSYVRCRAGVAYGASQFDPESTAFLYDTDAITMNAFGVFSLSGLSGGSISILAQAYALAGAKPASASNLAMVGGVALFTR